MAKPIQQTPVLEGESSKHFNKLLSANENKKVSSADKQRITQLVQDVLKKSASK